MHDFNQRFQEFTNLKSENEKLKAKNRELKVYKDQQSDFETLINQINSKDKNITELNRRIDMETENLAKYFKDLTIEQNKNKVLENKLSTIETQYKGLREELDNLEKLLDDKDDTKKVFNYFN